MLQGLLWVHTRLKQKQTRERKENPPRTTFTTNRLLNRATPANKKDEKGNKTPQRHENKKYRQSKTEHKQDAGPQTDRKANNISPNSRIKTQGLADEQQRKKERKTNKQRTRASNTRKLSNHKADTSKTTQNNRSKTPAGERGTSRPSKGGKEIPTPPSCRLATLPIREGVGRDGLSARGGEEGSLSTTLGQESKTKNKRDKETDHRAPQPIANHPGPRSTMDLGPGVEMQGAGGPRRTCSQEPASNKTVAFNKAPLKKPETPHLTKTIHKTSKHKANRFRCLSLLAALSCYAERFSGPGEGNHVESSQRLSCGTATTTRAFKRSHAGSRNL